MLNTNRNALVALGLLAQDVLGTATVASGLACTPTTIPSLGVQVGPGRLYVQTTVDVTAYSSLAADTSDLIVKQGIQLGSTTLACAAPTTTGYSINYLIEASYQDVDGSALVLPYYNASNPGAALSGPPGSPGAAQNTARRGAIVLSAKPGIPASSGAQSTPAPDPGCAGLHVVTVANGQASVTSANIATYPGANFLTSTLSSLAAAITSEASARSTAIAGTTALLQSYITSIQLQWTPNNTPVSPCWYKIATLPPSIASTADSITIKATLNYGALGASTSTIYDIEMGNRNGFACLHNIFGPNAAPCAIAAYREADGTVSVYAMGSSYSYAYLSIINSGAAQGLANTGPAPVLYPNPPSTTAPSGTLVFATNQPSVYPPLLNAVSPSTYATAASLQAFATAAANTAQTAAVAAAAAHTDPAVQGALSAAQAYAGGVANTAQSNAIAAATSLASSAQAAAIAAAEAYANGSSSLGTSWWLVEPCGLIRMGGVFAGQASSPATISFPKSGGFPTACYSINVTPIAQAASYFTSAPSASRTQFSLGFGASNTAFSWEATGK